MGVTTDGDEEEETNASGETKLKQVKKVMVVEFSKILDLGKRTKGCTECRKCCWTQMSRLQLNRDFGGGRK